MYCLSLLMLALMQAMCCYSALLLFTGAVASQPSGCPAGAYCAAQSGAPVECPVGYWCPPGSTKPQACPAKHDCSTAGAVPQKCPAGYFCPEKTRTPMLCPPHHFCPEDSSEPQLCPGGYRCEGEEFTTAKGWPLWKQLTATAESFMLVGGWHTMAMVKNQLWTWGLNDHGQLGIGHTNKQLQPVKVAIDKNFVAIAAGVAHSLALSHMGELWTWGYNKDGALGIGNTNKQLQPVKVAIDENFVAIAAGAYHSLALSDTGELWTWGNNKYGQLGIGHTNNQLQPVKVNRVFDIPKNAYFSCSDAAGFAFSACASSGGSAIPCFAQFLKARSDVGCSVGAKEAQECDAGTYCPSGKSYAITCPEGHFCNEGATRPEASTAG